MPTRTAGAVTGRQVIDDVNPEPDGLSGLGYAQHERVAKDFACVAPNACSSALTAARSRRPAPRLARRREPRSAR